MELTIEEKLLEMKLQLLTPYTKYKDKHQLKCLVCGQTTESSIQSRVQANKKNGTNGCPVCKQSIYSNAKQKFLQQINDKGYDVITPDYDGNQSSNVITVQRRECGHIFDITPTNLIHRDVICPLCSKKEK